MLTKLWALLSIILEIWDALKRALGLIEREKHEGNLKEIDEDSGKAKDPNLSEEERLAATKRLEDSINHRT